MFYNFYQYLNKEFFNKKNMQKEFQLTNYQGFDVYDNQWFIGIDENEKMQLWAIVRKRLIRNCGYYQPYRNNRIIKKILNWNFSCRKN
jgi:hypothetical protein